jgi:predicted DNA-binding protein (MmcQ/YjbR family)
MAKQNALARSAAALREHALSYPEAYEEFPWGHSAIKVKKKIFYACNLHDGVLSLSLKLPDSHKQALALPFTSPTEYGLGKSGWVTSKFTAQDNVPVGMIKEWIDESYRAIAPQKLVAKLD